MIATLHQFANMILIVLLVKDVLDPFVMIPKYFAYPNQCANLTNTVQTIVVIYLSKLERFVPSITNANDGTYIVIVTTMGTG